MIVFVQDLFVQDYVGGGELTTQAIIEATKIPILTVHSQKVTKQIIDQHKDKYWIFGNCAGLPNDIILYVCKNLNYTVIEYDYKFCSYRLPEKHIASEGKCDCQNSQRGKLFSVFFAKANNLWFMSAAQRQIYYDLFPFLDKPSTRVLSSVFNNQTIEYINSLDQDNKDDVWLIQDSPSWVKGSNKAVEYAIQKKIPYETFSGIEYSAMLKKFSKAKGFIFLPEGSDTCPRTVIEAKLLGCELVLNDNVQHKNEDWFIGSRENALEYLHGRADVFWSETYKHMGSKVPQMHEEPEDTRFKIIIPVYNSENWISRTIESVQDQKYRNYECYISDDMSTDNTFQVAQSVTKEDKFSVTKCLSKKYALKNIYDTILESNPSPEDVIVVLDGDDWFPNCNVLSQLNHYYKDSDCLMTYGSFVRFPDAEIGEEASQYSQAVIDNNTFREDQWRASHLKTFKFSLWDKVKKDDLLKKDGEFYEISYDQVMMLPMLEMAGSRSKYVPEVTYVYNITIPNAVNKTKAQKQHEYMLEIRKKPKYNRL